MFHLFVPFPSTLFALAAVAVLSTAAHSQEPGEKKDDKSGVLLRVLCKQPVTGATDLKIVQGEKVLHELKVTDSLMTDALPVGRGDLFLARQIAGGDKPTFDPVLKVTIPNEGKRFVLALFASSAPTPAKPYEYRLVRTDGLRFGISDLYLFNLTTTPIGGLLGKEKFSLSPDKSEVVTPKPDPAGERMYQCRFYCQVGEEVKIFNDTRWPVSMSARVYLFFIPDPERGSIGYLSFREYEPFP